MFPVLVRIPAFLLLATSLAMAQAQTASLSSDNLGTFKGARRVVVDHFGVEFITTLKARGLGGGSTANIDATLEGVSDGAMQALTDRAYQDTVAALTQAGFEVVSGDGRYLPAPKVLGWAEWGAARPA